MAWGKRKGYDVKKVCDNCLKETLINVPFGFRVADFLESGQAICNLCGCAVGSDHYFSNAQPLPELPIPKTPECPMYSPRPMPAPKPIPKPMPKPLPVKQQNPSAPISNQDAYFDPYEEEFEADEGREDEEPAEEPGMTRPPTRAEMLAYEESIKRKKEKAARR